MKKLLTMTIILAMSAGLSAIAQTQTQTKSVYSNKYIDVTVKQPVYTPTTTNVQDIEAVRKIQKTKETVDATKSSVKELKSLWGIK